MILLSPYYFSIDKAAKITGSSPEDIKVLLENDEIRSKKILVILDKEKRVSSAVSWL